MIREDGRRVISVDLGPELYSQICQLNALYGVGKTEFMRASVRMTLSIIATVSKAAGISQRDAIKALVEGIPQIPGMDTEVIRLDPRMDALLRDIFLTIARDDRMDSGNGIGIRRETEEENMEQGVSQ